MNFTVWYMRPEHFRDGIMGHRWLSERGRVPDPTNLDATHVKLGVFKATDLEDLFAKMQGEVWSPNGEKRDLILALGLQHTSMSVGDIAVPFGTNGEVHMVDNFGFVQITKEEERT